MNIFDFDAVDPEASEPIKKSYPLAQWVHGKQAMKAVGGVLYTGGVILPTRYIVDGFSIPGWDEGTITFENGAEEDFLGASKVVLASIRNRFRWVSVSDETISYYSYHEYDASLKMRGNLQVLCAIPEISEPIVITFKGKSSQALRGAMHDFRSKVVQIANKKAPKVPGTHAQGVQLPLYAFWATLVPAPHIKVGKGTRSSIITPPTLFLPQEVNDEFLRSIYIGREKLILFQQWFHEAEEWAKAWDTNQPNQQNKNQGDGGDDEGDIPF